MQTTHYILDSQQRQVAGIQYGSGEYEVVPCSDVFADLLEYEAVKTYTQSSFQSESIRQLESIISQIEALGYTVETV